MIHTIRNYLSSLRWVDPVLTFSVLGLVGFGITMVASSSYAVSQHTFSGPFHYFINQILRLLLGFVFGVFVLNFNLSFLERNAKKILLGSFILLLLVLVPGIGKTVNGSTRWLAFGPLRIQVSEIAKLGLVIYLSRYIVVYSNVVKTNIMGFINPMIMVSITVMLLILEPDLGTSVVLVSTSLAMLYLAGVSMRTFIVLVIIAITSFAVLAVSSPYRLARLTGFLDPWANQFDSGYQLTQSLIAFGRGGWLGTGIGGSIQKLFYLPEAHTDFIFAVIMEELGLLGGICILSLYSILFIRGMQIGDKAHKLGLYFNGYLAQGISLLMAIQMLINIGVNTGILPTKGLTLPFISYGGSSLIITCITLSLVFRVHLENGRGY